MDCLKKGDLLDSSSLVVSGADGRLRTTDDIVLCTKKEADEMARTYRCLPSTESLFNGSCSVNVKDGDRIVFLDMDGVVNRAFTDNISYVNKECMKWVCRLFEKTNAYCVLSTSWREFPDWNVFIRNFFACVGIRVIGSTPVIDRSYILDGESVFDVRPREIRRWLDLYSGNANVKYCVIDDNDYRNDFPGMAVCTCESGRIGMDEGWMNEASAILASDLIEEL